MKQIIIDTNAWMVIVEFKLDIFAALERDCDFLYQIAVFAGEPSMNCARSSPAAGKIQAGGVVSVGHHRSQKVRTIPGTGKVDDLLAQRFGDRRFGADAGHPAEEKTDPALSYDQAEEDDHQDRMKVMKELPEILDQFFEQYQQYQATKENSPHPELFSATVKIAINEYGISALAIATNFEVATSTVERWAKDKYLRTQDYKI